MEDRPRTLAVSITVLSFVLVPHNLDSIPEEPSTLAYVGLAHEPETFVLALGNSATVSPTSTSRMHLTETAIFIDQALEVGIVLWIAVDLLLWLVDDIGIVRSRQPARVVVAAYELS